MKASKKLQDFESLEVKASLRDGPQTYTGVVNEVGQLLAWGLASKAAQNEWTWVHKSYRKNPR